MNNLSFFFVATSCFRDFAMFTRLLRQCRHVQANVTPWTNCSKRASIQCVSYEIHVSWSSRYRGHTSENKRCSLVLNLKHGGVVDFEPSNAKHQRHNGGAQAQSWAALNLQLDEKATRMRVCVHKRAAAGICDRSGACPWHVYSNKIVTLGGAEFVTSRPGC